MKSARLTPRTTSCRRASPGGRSIPCASARNIPSTLPRCSLICSGILAGTSMVTMQVEPSGDGWKCLVTIEQGGDRTTHTVTVKRADAERWAGVIEPGDVQDLVLRSFEFLLEREAAGSILKTFDLATIQRYFPEYDRLIRP